MATAAPAPASATTYSEGFFSTPTDVANAAVQANLAVSNVDRAVSAAGTGSSAPQSWIDSWDAFKLVWSTWFGNNFQGKNVTAEWLTSDIEGQLESYQQQISSFANQAASYGISIPGGVPTVPTSNPLSLLPNGGTVLGALGLVALIIVLWKVL